ncbi:hypothetical protein, partial [Vibrio parahaemolyticus]|uniref:hypothetical protein n=1 Tax=Vibrio parahaemolyticus TaxID=670 RepID=UPI00053A410D
TPGEPLESVLAAEWETIIGTAIINAALVAVLVVWWTFLLALRCERALPDVLALVQCVLALALRELVLLLVLNALEKRPARPPLV